MKRPNNNDLENICHCPNCQSKIQYQNELFCCRKCSKDFPSFRKKPVLISDQNFLFHLSDYQETDTSISEKKKDKNNLFQIIKKYAPSKSLNLNRVRIFEQLLAICKKTIIIRFS